MVSRNVHLRVVNDAIRTNKEIARFAGRLGTKKNPRGKVLVIYRQLRRDLNRILSTDRSNAEKTRETNRILSVGSLALRGAISDVLGDAGGLGIDSASRQLSFYDIAATRSVTQFTSVNAGIDAAMATVTSQFDNILAQTAISADPAIIIGDAGRQGILRPSPIVRNSFDISATLTGALWVDQVQQSVDTETLLEIEESEEAFIERLIAAGLIDEAIDTEEKSLTELLRDILGEGDIGDQVTERRFFKQAIATMDDNVTETCLEVHGQIQPFSKPFHLIGTPRFANFIDAPPFHNHCRTSSALYDPGFELGITSLLEKSAQQILDLRAVGINPVISPANAFTPIVRGEVKKL